MWQLGPIEVYGLGASLGVIYLIGSWIGARPAQRAGIEKATWWRLTTGLVVLSVIGARLIAVVSNWQYFLAFPLEIVRIPMDRLSYYGALLTALVYLAAASRRLHVRFWRLLDLFALPWATGLVIAGAVWGVVSEPWAAPLWVTQLLSSVYLTGVYLLLWRVWTLYREGAPEGVAVLTVAAGDALLRLIVGLVGSIFLDDPWGGSPLGKITPAAVALMSLILVWRRGGRGLPREFLKNPFYRPLSRWFGWLVAYGLLLALTISLNASARF